MELSRDIVKDERIVKYYIQNASGTLQTTERATAMPENRDICSDACGEHICGRSRTFLLSGASINIAQPPKSLRFLDQQIEWLFQHLKQLAKWILILEAEPGSQDLVRDNTDRDQANQKRFNGDATGVRHEIQSSLSPRQEYEFDSKIKNGGNSGTAQRRTRGLPRRTSKRDHFFHDETNNNVLSDNEIDYFSKNYGITGAYPVLSYDDLLFWIKDHDGVVYLWSRMENSIMLVGHDMKDALMNYLFHQENLRYVNEYTHELITLDEAEREGKEWAESCEVETYVEDTSNTIVHKRLRAEQPISITMDHQQPE
ncbi:5215_t:CDS:2 [Funneliformis caledonium]|uniref:5215_t:CDS:1 n=1 Tax=Funneliformis caledonium TaxID=1117310 RepID=A0A9N9A0E6_9GLOM|nr:5215_t:CDS:2 [Funneliformis caledonium]